MIGCAFMGKAYRLGYRDVPLIAGNGVRRPRLVSPYGRDMEKLEAARCRLGWEDAVLDWNEIVANPRVQLLDNSGPNALDVEPTIAAARAGNMSTVRSR